MAPPPSSTVFFLSVSTFSLWKLFRALSLKHYISFIIVDSLPRFFPSNRRVFHVTPVWFSILLWNFSTILSIATESGTPKCYGTERVKQRWLCWGWDAFLQQRPSVPRLSAVYRMRARRLLGFRSALKEAFLNRTYLYLCYFENIQ